MRGPLNDDGLGYLNECNAIMVLDEFERRSRTKRVNASMVYGQHCLLQRLIVLKHSYVQSDTAALFG